MRSNIYFIVSRIAKFGFKDEKIREEVEIQLIDQLELVPNIIEDLNTLCLILK